MLRISHYGKVSYVILIIFCFCFFCSWIGQLLMLQDFTHINNLMHFEYTIVQNYIQTKSERPT
ncbi:unnamed protein product [Schistosoma margrebowiei]|uniref:Uncharacterized protein n=2 Tax=Schistosoma TaxID=6181 RepID=A0A183LWJ2_9TREM|nr:unnamed protein product [Schistosoma margrebowiei]